ncbi:MAG TPA: hypothetical protein PKV86_12290, partial [Syntrophobacteraceae bacterium]|nr:hypothetical protein [Syntrophobacteraceae bacterium]
MGLKIPLRKSLLEEAQVKVRACLAAISQVKFAVGLVPSDNGTLHFMLPRQFQETIDRNRWDRDGHSLLRFG